MRALLRSTIEIANEGLIVAGEAVDGEDAVNQWREKRPEIVVLDQRMPGPSALEVAERILAEHPDQAIILFTAYLDPDIADRAAQLGIRACMSKRDISRAPLAHWKYAPDTYWRDETQHTPRSSWRSPSTPSTGRRPSRRPRRTAGPRYRAISSPSSYPRRWWRTL